VRIAVGVFPAWRFAQPPTLREQQPGDDELRLSLDAVERVAERHGARAVAERELRHLVHVLEAAERGDVEQGVLELVRLLDPGQGEGARGVAAVDGVEVAAREARGAVEGRVERGHGHDEPDHDEEGGPAPDRDEGPPTQGGSPLPHSRRHVHSIGRARSRRAVPARRRG
jgi:hypothetical protein